MNYKFILLSLFIILCGCQGRKRRVFDQEIKEPVLVKLDLDTSDPLVMKVDAIIYILMTIITFIIAIINLIRHEVEKYRNKLSLRRLEECQRLRDHEEYAERLRNTRRNYDNDNRILNNDEISTLINNNS